MKKKFISTFLSLCLILSSVVMFGCGDKKTSTSNEAQKVRLNEVVRSVFYAPMYVALNQGFFKEEGLDIDLTTGQGADAHMFKTQV